MTSLAPFRRPFLLQVEIRISHVIIILNLHGNRSALVILDTGSGKAYVPSTGDVAQLGERRLRKSEVVGSNPIISIAIKSITLLI